VGFAWWHPATCPLTRLAVRNRREVEACHAVFHEDVSTEEVVVAAGIGGDAEAVVDVGYEVGEGVEFAAEGLDFGLGAAVYVEVELAAEAVAGVLAVLTHHDDGRLNGGEHGEEEVEQDEGVRVPRSAMGGDEDGAEADIGEQCDAEGDDERPGTAEAGDAVGDALAKGFLLIDELVGVAVGADTDEGLGGVDLAGGDGEHVEAGEGFLFEQDGDVVAVDLEAGGGFGGCRGGLVRDTLEHGGEAEDVAVDGLGEEDFLAVFVDEGDFDAAGEQDEGGAVGVAGFVDALLGGEVAEFDLLGEDGEFVVVEEREEGDVAEFVGGAGHIETRD
jgi:hypothetical protein